MATALKLKADIKNLKAAINSKATPKSYLPKLKEQLAKAENELESVQKGGKPRKTSTTKKTATTLSALQKLIKKKEFSIYKNSGVDLKKDAGEGAMKTGRRVSKGLKSNQYGSAADNKGNVYYEYRPNRIDVKQPKRKQTYPKLADGGKLYARGGGVDKKYTHFAVRKSDNLILTGWDYKGVDKESISYYTKMDLNDMDVKPSDYKILSKTFLKAKGIDPFNWDNWVSSKKMANGGETEEGVDLFEDYESIPDNVQKILDKYSDAFENGDYKGLTKAHNELTKIGYTFDFYLDGQAYDLRKIGQKGKSEDEYANGGMMAKGGKMFPHKIVLTKPDGEQLDVATFAGQGDAFSCANHLTNSNSMGYTYKVVSKKANGGELHRTKE